jgi:CDP-glucose 4,6-dehydratase
MNAEFWRKKKVFLTGHTGFKGSWLALWLQKMDAEVCGYALAPPTNPNLFEQAKIAQGMKSVIADIRDAEQVRAALQAFAPEIVIHMAAQPLVRYSYQYPIETYAVNVLGTVHVLEAARHTDSVRAIVNVTSDKCYENREWVWGYREEEAMGGFDPYSNSKGCAELVTSSYRRSFFHDKKIGLASGRAGNVIGGGDWAQDRLVPDLVRACIAEQTVKIRYPQAIRPWQHVLEPLSGYLQLAEQLYQNPAAFAQGWNFGPRDHDAWPVSQIVEKFLSIWGGGVAWEVEAAPQHHEAHYLKLDCSKAQTLLNWQPRWTLEQALQACVTWYQACAQQQNLQALTLQQIESYLQTSA